MKEEKNKDGTKKPNKEQMKSQLKAKEEAFKRQQTIRK